MGMKIIDIKMQRDASRGRKSKAGEGIKSDSIIYTPALITNDGKHRESKSTGFIQL